MYQNLPKLFTPQGVEKIKTTLSEIPPKNAELSSGMDKNYRSVQERSFCEGYDWIIDPILEVVIEANKKWGFDITGLSENLGYLTYKNKNDQYKRHIDLHCGDIGTTTPNRKITFIVQLSDGKDYEGCDLMLDGGTIDEAISRDKGSITLFPSFLAHYVTPLLSGERHSIVGWVAGASWR